MKKQPTTSTGKLKMGAPPAYVSGVDVKVVKRDPYTVSAASTAVWNRYIDSRMKQFATR